MKSQIVIQKYGGATLATPAQIRAAAERITKAHRDGQKIVAIVSAMGQTTNALIELAHQVSREPSLRELDMLLSTGERMSMALLSMALQDLGVPAISFTGSQAGILTDERHVNALIVDVKAFRVQEALEQGQVVVLAGFQGVSPITKEITTLGRGGTDTTAVAMAAYLKADHCEILKDVPAVFSADPRLISQARPITNLTYSQLSEMCFWGAKVLHYRSVELATSNQVPLYIGPAIEDLRQGTWVDLPPSERTTRSSVMFEKIQILSLNSFETVLVIEAPLGLTSFLNELKSHQIPAPQILMTQASASLAMQLWLTAPIEVLSRLQNLAAQTKHFSIRTQQSVVTATCTGSTTPELQQLIHETLQAQQIPVATSLQSAMSLSLFVRTEDRLPALNCLHSLLGK